MGGIELQVENSEVLMVREESTMKNIKELYSIMGTNKRANKSLVEANKIASHNYKSVRRPGD